jgi:hypothetical protein
MRFTPGKEDYQEKCKDCKEPYACSLVEDICPLECGKPSLAAKYPRESIRERAARLQMSHWLGGA